MSKPHLNRTSDSRKRPLHVICSKCKRKVDIKNTVTCSVCKENYEFDCIGYSEKLHRLKDAETRKHWQCTKCDQKLKIHSSQSSHSPSYVTIRKKTSSPNTSKDPKPMIISSLQNTPTASITLQPDDSPIPPKENDETLFSQIDDSHILTTYQDREETTDNFLSKSMDCTIVDPLPVQELTDTINLLRSEYIVLQNEFDNTLLENSDLRQQISKLTKENQTLKSLCQSPPSDSQLIEIALINTNN